MNIGRILKATAKKAKENPGLTLAVIGLVALGAVTKLAPVIVAATRPKP